MKKITLVATLLLGGASISWAQTGVQAGLKAGLTTAVLSGSINQNTKYKSGFHVGGMLRVRPSRVFAFQPELIFSQQGSSNEIPLGPVTLENKTKLSYLNIPLLAKLYLSEAVNLQVGPQVGLLLAARQTGQTGYYSGSGGSGFRTEDLDVKADYKGDVGLCMGLGVDLKSGLTFAARVNYGLTDINNNEQEKQLREALRIKGLYNRVLEFSLGYLFSSK
ncbi:porin family protein [Hymenobacter sp. UYP22]|uniref:porin family protein n=1 Tax=Hymenobacter sp. UYP22 TaxID=3156348 RepID=UPI0033938A9F